MPVTALSSTLREDKPQPLKPLEKVATLRRSPTWRDIWLDVKFFSALVEAVKRLSNRYGGWLPL